MKYCYELNFGELFLKGNNQKIFINKLIQNLKNLLFKKKIEIYKIQINRGFIYIEVSDKKAEYIFKNIFGLSNFYKGESISCDIDKIKKYVLRIVNKYKENNFSIKIHTKRRDKNFSLNSLQTNLEVAEFVFQHTKKNISACMINPELEVVVNINKNNIFITRNHDKYCGAGGIPTECTGRGLMLLSGGIDSPVASFLAMKRGLDISFLHFYSITEKLESSKIIKLIKEIIKYKKCNATLYAIPCVSSFINLEKKYEKYSVVLFRRFMLSIAKEICKKNNFDTIITGDNLAQVASQTLSNMTNISQIAENILILRPLICFDKKEIIKMAKKINTYDISIMPYKDCCSAINKKDVSTVSNINKILDIENTIKLNDLVEKFILEMKIIHIS